MAYRELIDFVHTARAKGIGDDVIAMRLREAGWYTVDVQDALELHSKLNRPEVGLASTVAPTVSRKQVNPVWVLALLAFVLGFVGYLLLTR